MKYKSKAQNSQQCKHVFPQECPTFHREVYPLAAAAQNFAEVDRQLFLKPLASNPSKINESKICIIYIIITNVFI